MDFCTIEKLECVIAPALPWRRWGRGWILYSHTAYWFCIRMPWFHTEIVLYSKIQRRRSRAWISAKLKSLKTYWLRSFRSCRFRLCSPNWSSGCLAKHHTLHIPNEKGGRADEAASYRGDGTCHRTRLDLESHPRSVYSIPTLVNERRYTPWLKW